MDATDGLRAKPNNAPAAKAVVAAKTTKLLSPMDIAVCKKTTTKKSGVEFVRRNS